MSNHHIEKQVPEEASNAHASKVTYFQFLVNVKSDILRKRLPKTFIKITGFVLLFDKLELHGLDWYASSF